MIKLRTHSFTKINELFYAGAVAVTNRLIRLQREKKPMWMRKLQNKIKVLCKGLSQLESSKDKEVNN